LVEWAALTFCFCFWQSNASAHADTYFPQSTTQLQTSTSSYQDEQASRQTPSYYDTTSIFQQQPNTLDAFRTSLDKSSQPPSTNTATVVQPASDTTANPSQPAPTYHEQSTNVSQTISHVPEFSNSDSASAMITGDPTPPYNPNQCVSSTEPLSKPAPVLSSNSNYHSAQSSAPKSEQPMTYAKSDPNANANTSAEGVSVANGTAAAATMVKAEKPYRRRDCACMSNRRDRKNMQDDCAISCCLAICASLPLCCGG